MIAVREADHVFLKNCKALICGGATDEWMLRREEVSVSETLAHLCLRSTWVSGRKYSTDARK